MTFSKTEIEQVLRLILQLSLIRFRVFRVYTHAFRQYNPSNQSNVWKYAGSFLHYSIDTQTYLLRKTSKDWLPLPVVNLDKASVCGDRKTSFSFWQKWKIEIHIYRKFRSVGRDSYWGPNISRSRRYRVWSHVCQCIYNVLSKSNSWSTRYWA